MAAVIISRDVTYKNIKAHRLGSLNKNWQNMYLFHGELWPPMSIILSTVN